LDGYITPPEMATYDIVLTTYEVLKTEVYFSDNLKGISLCIVVFTLSYLVGAEFGRVLRHPKKYLPPRTPLSLLHWWRVSYCVLCGTKLMPTFEAKNFFVCAMDSHNQKF